MKSYKLVLTKDTRSADIVLYKEIIGTKLFSEKQLNKVVNGMPTPTTFIKNVKLLDLTTKTYTKQKVFLRVAKRIGKYLEVEVY